MHSQNPPPKLKKSNKSLLLHLLLHPLPEEIIEEIVSRLPVKSLLRFRCVSKSWLSLIKSDRFIKTHFQNSTKITNYRVIFHVKRHVMNGWSLQSLLNRNPEEGSSPSSSYIIIDPTNNRATTDFLVVGCCNGVLCLSKYPIYERCLLLWNPATRVSIELPKLDNVYKTKWGFGWDESSAAFKVFATGIENSNFTISSRVYSSKTNLWKTVPLGSLNLFNLVGVFVGGRLHWGMEHVIESFDLESDEFGRIELPPFNTNANANANVEEDILLAFLVLGEIRGYLCTLFDYKKSVDVWVMKEYGVKDSWFKLHSFPLGVDQPIYGFPSLFAEGLNGEIFIIYKHTLMVYSLKDGAFSRATNIISLFHSIYVESLVSPQTNNT